MATRPDNGIRKTHLQPRLTSLHAHTLDSYSYSGIVMTPQPMTQTLQCIENRIYQLCDESFTTVLLNLYRDGKDSNGWHADDEAELGKIQSSFPLSLGAPRFFHLRHNQDPKQRYVAGTWKFIAHGGRNTTPLETSSC